MSLLRFYRSPALSVAHTNALLASVRAALPGIRALDTEVCFYVQGDVTSDDRRTLVWLLGETFAPDMLGDDSSLDEGGTIVEVGPRLSFSTAWSTNAVGICRACGLRSITRLERSRRFRITSDESLTDEQIATFLAHVHDRMTECHYTEPLTTFETGVEPEASFEVPILQQGRAALEQLNRDMGLAFDDWDLDYYLDLFKNRIGRNPTNVECFDIAQSNSVIAFNDNSSAIRGFMVDTILPARVGGPCAFVPARVDYNVLLTAETHNFPSGVAPFPGAETGTGGRIRDTHATGRGSLVVAGTAAYCVGNLRVPGYPLPWEEEVSYPSNLAAPLTIELDASNGASDYGNKFGEPVIAGYTRSFGLRLPNGDRREWLKPIMFSGGIGQLDARHTDKGAPENEMWVVKLGGPAYRIGMGGGAASSMVQGENVAELDFNAVQRGDAEMEQKTNRVIRACVELGDNNPIVSIHDQGAGGNCNVLKEIVDPAGAKIDIRAVHVGDETLSVLEIWGAEYQENDALLLRPEHEQVFRDLCAREMVPVAFVGRVTGDGRILVHDSRDDSTPVDLELSAVLGDMPQKTFELERVAPTFEPLVLPEDLTVRTALERVLRLLSVGSKRFLTTKVDRSVTGLIAQQQCAGPLQLTVADVAVIAQSHFGISGAATAIGEQPIKGLLDPAAMARMSLGEALTNLVWARVTALADVRCSANWMWAAKLRGEGAALYDAAIALRDMMLELDVAVDGGKDSLSMAARAPTTDGSDETVKAPGSLVISAYVTCPDVRATVTPDLKTSESKLLFVDLSDGHQRLGGSALAQVFGQIGDDCPDAEPALLTRAFDITQELIANDVLLAGHDRSDGGLITAVLEMAFAGNRGVDLALEGDNAIALLFAEELGLVLEVNPDDEARVTAAYRGADVPCMTIGQTRAGPEMSVRVGGDLVLDDDIRDLRDLWEETSFQLDRMQANPECVEQEQSSLGQRAGPTYSVSFEPRPTPATLLTGDKPRVAILREEGSNGDREMSSAFFAAGFEPWDVAMSDLADGRVTLEQFRGVVAVGGFSYADVLDSAKGWAGVVRFNDGLRQQFADFYGRGDTFSLGICNGCQLLALLGWVPWTGIADTDQPRFIQNSSGRFESRFSTVRIEESPAIMLRGMADSVLGVWVAHGEGRAYFPSSDVLARVRAKGLAPVRYVDDSGDTTEAYPLNPNGSPHGIAGLCSVDGRHLAMMPHPERTFLSWQWPWMSDDLRRLATSPWLRMFQNARTWCQGQAWL